MKRNMRLQYFGFLILTILCSSAITFISLKKDINVNTLIDIILTVLAITIGGIFSGIGFLSAFQNNKERKLMFEKKMYQDIIWAMCTGLYSSSFLVLVSLVFRVHLELDIQNIFFKIYLIVVFFALANSFYAIINICNMIIWSLVDR